MRGDDAHAIAVASRDERVVEAGVELAELQVDGRRSSKVMGVRAPMAPILRPQLRHKEVIGEIVWLLTVLASLVPLPPLLYVLIYRIGKEVAV